MSVIVGSVALPTGTWSVDPVHSSIEYAVGHNGISLFRGSFPSFAGSIRTEGGKVVALAGTVDTRSLAPADPNLAAHLQGEDFFAVDRFPEARFVASSVVEDEGRLEVVGDLTIREITLPAVLSGTRSPAVLDAYGNTRTAFELRGTIDRTAFGIDWNAELADGGRVVSHEVTIELHVEAVLGDAS
ncbi:MAG: YceI family protein [Gaiella sp.]